MNRFVWMSTISISLLWTVGCSGPKVSQEDAVIESEVAVTPPPSPQVTPKQKSQILAQIPQLTPSTSAEERLAQLKEGQRDPFSPLDTHPIVTPGQITITQAPPTPTPEVTVKPNPTPSPIQPLPVIPLPAPNPIPSPQLPTVQPNPSVQAIPQTIEVAQVQPIPTPSPVTPSGAEAVKVTGVAELPDGMRAILKAPDEPTSRYVVAGEFLSNGTIQVKRIEIASSGNPIVVLEENGKEFIKTISDRP